MYDHAHFLGGNATGKRRGIWPLFSRHCDPVDEKHPWNRASFSGRAERVVLTPETGPNRVRNFGYISGNRGV